PLEQVGVLADKIGNHLLRHPDAGKRCPNAKHNHAFAVGRGLQQRLGGGIKRVLVFVGVPCKVHIRSDAHFGLFGLPRELDEFLRQMVGIPHQGGVGVDQRTLAHQIITPGNKEKKSDRQRASQKAPASHVDAPPAPATRTIPGRETADRHRPGGRGEKNGPTRRSGRPSQPRPYGGQMPGNGTTWRQRSASPLRSS
ncbi:MAG: hypothetical protein ACK56I_15580, partial [bacterium]